MQFVCLCLINQDCLGLINRVYIDMLPLPLAAIRTTDTVYRAKALGYALLGDIIELNNKSGEVFPGAAALVIPTGGSTFIVLEETRQGDPGSKACGLNSVWFLSRGFPLHCPSKQTACLKLFSLILLRFLLPISTQYPVPLPRVALVTHSRWIVRDTWGDKGNSETAEEFTGSNGLS